VVAAEDQDILQVQVVLGFRVREIPEGVLQQVLRFTEAVAVAVQDLQELQELQLLAAQAALAFHRLLVEQR
jgi:hypothetical protein